MCRVVLQTDGLVCYGGLNRKNQRESESLMLQSYFYSVLCQNALFGLFQEIRLNRERLNPAERLTDMRHPINLRLSNWRVPALIVISIIVVFGDHHDYDGVNDNEGDDDGGTCLYQPAPLLPFCHQVIKLRTVEAHNRPFLYKV